MLLSFDKKTDSDGEATTDLACSSVHERSTSSSDNEDFDLHACDAASEIDLQPEEGQRRGAELLSMLSDFGMGTKSANVDIPVPPPKNVPPRPVAQPWLQTEQTRGLTRQLVQDRGCAVAAAAQRTFGSGFISVSESAAGYTLWLSEDVQLEQFHGRFAREIWPLLDHDVLSVVPQDVTGEEPLMRLRMWCIGSGSHSKDLCQSFSRYGECPRGRACQWRHDVPQSYWMDIDLFC